MILHYTPIYGLLILGLTLIPPLQALFEDSLIGQTLLVIPLLVIAGVLLANGLPRTWRVIYSQTDPHGIIALLIAGYTIAFWLLPRNVDGAVIDQSANWVRQITLPLIAGIPLGLASHRIPIWFCSLLWAMGTAMLFVMGWLYTVAPTRLCNSYLITEQQTLGTILLTAGTISLGVVFSVAVLGLCLGRLQRPAKHRVYTQPAQAASIQSYH